MIKTVFALCTVFAGILFFADGAKAADIKEGQWSMTTVIQMDGMDDQTAEAMQEMENMAPEERAMAQKMMGGMNIGGRGISTTITQCLTNENPVPEANDQEDCQQTHTIERNTVHFTVMCPDSNSIGQVTYTNDTMEGSIQSTQTANGKATSTTINISGKYVGPCGQDTADAAPEMDIPSAAGLSEKELSLREKELDLKRQELELKQKELELQAAANTGTNKPAQKSALEKTEGAVNTGNRVKNTFSGMKSLLGR